MIKTRYRQEALLYFLISDSLLQETYFLQAEIMTIKVQQPILFASIHSRTISNCCIYTRESRWVACKSRALCCVS